MILSWLTTESNDADLFILQHSANATGQISLYPNSVKGQSQYTIHLPPAVLANSYVLVPVIGNGRTQTFTVLEQ